MSNREEIQITDLEPSIEGGEDIEYIVQIRGIDATGRPGPWSDELKFTSPQQIPSLQSFNYVPGEGGWRLDNDGTFEVNDGTIRGTLESSNYVPDVSGWRLSPNGFAEFGSGIFRGALRIGQNTFNVDPNGNLYIGGTTPQNAPFSVDTNGNILAMSIDAGFITAGTIGAGVVYAGTIVASQITSGTINGNRIPNLDTSKITSGVFDPVFIPNLSANKITTGTLNANNVTISGQLSSVTLAIGSGNNSFRIDSSGNMWLGNTSFNNAVFRVSNTGNVRSLGRIDVEGGGRLGAARGIITDLSCDFIEASETCSIPFLFSLNTTGNVVVGGQFFVNNAPSSTSTAANVRWNTINNRFERFLAGSSIRYKQDIVEPENFYKILDLKPRVFRYRSDVESLGDEAPINYGLIAEEMSNLDLDYLVDLGDADDGLPDSIKYDKIAVALIPIIKELKEKIEQLEEQLNGS